MMSSVRYSAYPLAWAVEDEKEYLCMDKEKVVEAPQHISLIAICTPAVVSRLISGR